MIEKEDTARMKRLELLALITDAKEAGWVNVTGQKLDLKTKSLDQTKLGSAFRRVPADDPDDVFNSALWRALTGVFDDDLMACEMKSTKRWHAGQPTWKPQGSPRSCRVALGRLLNKSIGFASFLRFCTSAGRYTTLTEGWTTFASKLKAKGLKVDQKRVYTWRSCPVLFL